MTLDEFLDDYVPNKLRQLPGWGLVRLPGAPHAYIRRDMEGRDVSCCPLTAAFEHPSLDWKSDAMALGLSADDSYAIITAADGESFYGWPIDATTWSIRARLLAGLGLSEPGGER